MPKQSSPRAYLSPRAKIGVLTPGRNTTVEVESNNMCPAGVTNHVARMGFKNAPKGIDPVSVKIGVYDLDIEGTIDSLKFVDPDLILLGHSHDSFVGGVKGGQAMQDRLTAYAGLPVYVPSIAYVSAIKALGINNVAILTPYLADDDSLVKNFFEDAGCNVRRVLPLLYDTAYAIAATDASIVRDSFLELDGDDIDAILQVGTNLPCLQTSVEAEFWLEKPVLSVNIVTYWHALRQFGIKDQRDDLGLLFSNH
jgi:maleate isomerase